MALDEFTTILRSRAFVSKVGPTAIPVPMGGYLANANAVVRVENGLQDELQGMSFSMKGQNYICVNGRDSAERQRFTICHEIAHIVLGLPSDHNHQWWSAKRPIAERLCDVFAAELLLPDNLFQPLAEASSVGLAAIDALAAKCEASITATGSRFASVVTTPCAFILSEGGKVRYASRSKALIDARAWIAPRAALHEETLSHRVRSGGAEERIRVAADLWFTDWERGGTVLEEARHLPKWDQTVTLVWLEDEHVLSAPLTRSQKRWDYEGREDRDDPQRGQADEDLTELDGNLRWNRKDRYR